MTSVLMTARVEVADDTVSLSTGNLLLMHCENREKLTQKLGAVYVTVFPFVVENLRTL